MSNKNFVDLQYYNNIDNTVNFDQFITSKLLAVIFTN